MKKKLLFIVASALLIGGLLVLPSINVNSNASDLSTNAVYDPGNTGGGGS